ncbi:hypothetical protein SAMN05444404_0975 [Ruegeria lacuscaerulensis ITI-1157]|nr:hypothetical protein SAMN05444404_0975 [Ruegeria lacuscaerulensis ITI-1157]
MTATYFVIATLLCALWYRQIRRQAKAIRINLTTREPVRDGLNMTAINEP